jgi:hypothetical protein
LQITQSSLPSFPYFLIVSFPPPSLSPALPESPTV